MTQASALLQSSRFCVLHRQKIQKTQCVIDYDVGSKWEFATDPTIEADLSKRGIGLVVLSMGGERLDTRNPTSKLMLTILAGVATWEREIMLERQREGIAKAKAEGKYLGRKATIEAGEVLALKAEGIGPAAIAKRLGIARSSVYRMLEQKTAETTPI